MPLAPRHILFPALLLWLCAGCPGVARAEDEVALADIIEAHTQALGGQEAIAQVRNFHRKAEVTLQGSFGSLHGTAEEIVDLRDDRFYSNLDLVQYKRIEALAGNEGWFKGTRDGEGKMDAGQVVLAQMNLGVSPLLVAYNKAGDALVVQGKRRFSGSGKQCHVVSWGAEILFFIDEETALLDGMKIGDFGTVSLSDYQLFSEVKMPRNRRLQINAESVTIVYRFKSIEAHAGIDDSLMGDLADTKKPNAMVEGQKKNSPGRQKHAPDGKMTGEKIVASMDRNKDGRISREEANEELKVFFDERDTNGDDFIDSIEAEVIAKFMNANR